MNIFDTITLLRAGYTKKEIEAMKAEEPTPAAPAEALRPQEAPVDMPDREAEAPAPPASIPPATPEEDPRIAELEQQVKALQAKLIQVTAVDTAQKTDPIMDIANALINGGK